ncbi:MAG: hypothetical protein E2604_05455, partial [Flavobacterium sp.]|nr:hypothetical protein [Flavobacterium sp.]
GPGAAAVLPACSQPDRLRRLATGSGRCRSTAGHLLQKNLYVQAFQNFIQAKFNAVISLKIYDFYKGEPIKL